MTLPLPYRFDYGQDDDDAAIQGNFDEIAKQFPFSRKAIQNGTITGGKLAADTITADNIKAGTITATEIQANSLTGDRLVAGTITADELAADAVTTEKIQADAITANEIAASAVDTDQLAAGAVTATKIASGAITSAAIAAGTITGGDIAAGTITGANLVANTIDTNQLDATAIDGMTITGATVQTGSSGARVVIDTGGISAFDASDDAVLDFDVSTGDLQIKGELLTGSVVPAASVTGQLTSDQIEALAASKLTGEITTTQITDDAITTAKVAAGAITTAEIASTTIVADNIASSAITTDKLQAEAVTAAKIASGTITADQIASGTITATQIAANAIGASELAADSVTASALSAGAIDGTTITGATIRTGSGGDRVQMNSDGLATFVDSATTLQVKAGTTNGAIEIVGTDYRTVYGDTDVPRSVKWLDKDGSTKTGAVSVDTTDFDSGGVVFLADRLHLVAGDDEAGLNAIYYRPGTGHNVLGSEVAVFAGSGSVQVLNSDAESDFVQLPSSAHVVEFAATVNSNGTVANAIPNSALSVARTATGTYTVTFGTTFAAQPAVNVTVIGSGASATSARCTSISTTTAHVQLLLSSGALGDAAFSIHVVGEA